MEGKSNLDTTIIDFLFSLDIDDEDVETIKLKLKENGYKTLQNLIADPPKSVEQLERWKVPGRWANKIFDALGKLGQPTDITVGFIENLFRNWETKKGEYFFVQEFGRRYHLLDRDTAKSTIISIFSDHYSKLDSDRKVHPFVAFAGCPGSGKSRMLDEMPSIISPTLKAFNSKATLLPIKVSYTNGTPYGKWDKHHPIAAFCWRLLFAYYNPDIPFSSYWNNLPKHWYTLDLSTVLKILFKPDIFVLLLLDEFQYLLQKEDRLINSPPDIIKEHGPSTMKLVECNSILQNLIVLLSEPLCSTPRSFFMAMSGIYVGPLYTISTHSGYPINRIPLKPISFDTFYQIFPTENPYLLLRYHFACLVGLPQLFISYEEYKMKMTEQEAYKTVIANFTSKIRDSNINWIRPIFYSIAVYVTHKDVVLSDHVGDTDFTYEDLQSNGLISVNDGNLFIPYPLMMSVTTLEVEPLFVPMRSSLKYIKEQVDDRLSMEEMWVLWERFGIGYKSLKTNALVLLNNTKTTFGTLHEGAIMTSVLAETEITLQNLEIKHSPLPFKSIDSELFTQSGQQINWKKGDCVVLNGPRGKAMDSFSYYPTSKLLDVEQRKQHEDSLNPSNIPKIVKPIRTLFGNDVCIGIFYNGPCSKKIKEKLTDDKVYVVTEGCLPIYYYAFKNHPIVSSEVYVNEPFTLQTSIASYISPGSTEKRNNFARKVIELRAKGHQFKSWIDLKTTICKLLNSDDYVNLKCTPHLKFNLFGIRKGELEKFEVTKEEEKEKYEVLKEEEKEMFEVTKEEEKEKFEVTEEEESFSLKKGEKKKQKNKQQKKKNGS